MADLKIYSGTPNSLNAFCSNVSVLLDDLLQFEFTFICICFVVL